MSLINGLFEDIHTVQKDQSFYPMSTLYIDGTVLLVGGVFKGGEIIHLKGKLDNSKHIIVCYYESQDKIKRWTV